MPIRRELRHFYRGPAWRATRARILERAGNCCERCGVPNRTIVLRAFSWWTPNSLEAIVFKNNGLINGKPVTELPWRCRPNQEPHVAHFPGPKRWVGIVLTIAHLNHVAGDDRDENLQALCQYCHLTNDAMQHARNARRTRQVRKDAARPLLRLLEVAS